MIKVEGDRTLYVDCDDTLVLWNISDYPDSPRIKINLYHEDTVLVPHQKNINLLIKFRKLGYKIIVWSQSGADWAEAVVNQLLLSDYVDLVITKPTYYLDDLPASAWADRRVYRELVEKEV
jgi:FMN phosphatase YigB (HAD superfamily)